MGQKRLNLLNDPAHDWRLMNAMTSARGQSAIVQRMRLAMRDARKRDSQAAIAAICRVSQPAVSQWAAGVTEPSQDVIRRFANELGVCVEWIATGKGPMRPEPDRFADPVLNEAREIWAVLSPESRLEVLRTMRHWYAVVRALDRKQLREIVSCTDVDATGTHRTIQEPEKPAQRPPAKRPNR